MSVLDSDTPTHVLLRTLLADSTTARQELQSAGFRDPGRAFRNIQGLARPGELQYLPPDFFQLVLRTPDPDRALNNFERLTDAAFGRSSFYQGLRDQPAVCHILLNILGSSQFLSDTLVRDPEYLYWLVETPDRLRAPRTKDDLFADLSSELGIFGSVEARLNALRGLVRRELLRVGAGDLVGDRPINGVAAELSDLADVCLQHLLDLLTPEVDDRYGAPRNRDWSRAEFAIISLGKLGGRELNFSSDLDLMFVYSEDGETDGGGSHGKAVSNQEYFSRLAERIVRTATEPTVEGFIYRIDLRLRPEGASGALTMPLAAYEGYYTRRGELWERQMLIKARTSAGSADLGRRFIETILPFVYPRHFEASPVDEIGRIKRRIEDHIGRRGKGETHLKLRSGGIRDVEFIVQCLQLLVGRVHTEARSGNTLEAIGQLQRASALSATEAGPLRAAYVFFRRLEHRLQMMHGLSDHGLPDSDKDQAPLALSLGLTSPADYRAALNRHLASVQAVYRDVFADEREGEGRSIGAIFEMEVGDSEAGSLLEQFGFSRPQDAHRNLVFLAYGHVPRIRGARARQSFVELAPPLIQALQGSIDPDQALGNLERLISAYGAGDTLFRILQANRGFRDLLISLCAGSQFPVDLIVQNPAFLDWLILPDVLYHPPDDGELGAEIDSAAARATSDDDLAAALNAFKNRELLRIGARDLVAMADTFETFEALTRLSEAILGRIYHTVYDRLTARRGVPRSAAGGPTAYAVLGLGKLGGRELNFGSDLDLVFVYSEDGLTDGPKPVENLQFHVDLSQQILNALGRSSPHGILYPVDARLRPEGGSAMLALSYDAYDRYLQNRAATWERLALSRTRVVAGDLAFGRKVLDRIERFVVGAGLTGAEASEIVRIRKRMEDQGARRSPDQLSIKTGSGGLVDIEFIVQALQLRHGSSDPGVRSINTLESLGRLKEGGYLPPEDAVHLDSAFRLLRTVEKVLRRQDKRARTRLPSDDERLTALARALAHPDSKALAEGLERSMTMTRRIFEVHLGRP